MALGPMTLASKVQSLASRCLEAEFYGLGTHGLGLEGPVLGLEAEFYGLGTHGLGLEGPVLGLEVPRG